MLPKSSGKAWMSDVSNLSNDLRFVLICHSIMMIIYDVDFKCGHISILELFVFPNVFLLKSTSSIENKSFMKQNSMSNVDE